MQNYKIILNQQDQNEKEKITGRNEIVFNKNMIYYKDSLLTNKSYVDWFLYHRCAIQVLLLFILT